MKLNTLNSKSVLMAHLQKDLVLSTLMTRIEGR